MIRNTCTFQENKASVRKVIFCYAVLYYNVGTGTAMTGQTMAGFFSSRLAQLGTIYAHLMCVLVPGLNLGRLAVYSCGHAHANLQV